MNHPSARAPVGERMPVMCDTMRGGTGRKASSTSRSGSFRVTGYLRAKSEMRSG